MIPLTSLLCRLFWLCLDHGYQVYIIRFIALLISLGVIFTQRAARTTIEIAGNAINAFGVQKG